MDWSCCQPTLPSKAHQAEPQTSDTVTGASVCFHQAKMKLATPAQSSGVAEALSSRKLQPDPNPYKMPSIIFKAPWIFISRACISASKWRMSFVSSNISSSPPRCLSTHSVFHKRGRLMSQSVGSPTRQATLTLWRN